MVNRTSTRGFMLVELLVALLITSMVCGMAYAVCSVYRRHHRNQQLMLSAHQNLSGAVVVMEQMIRMAGYDPEESGQFGIVDVRRYDLVAAGRVNNQGEPALFYTYDRNGDGVLEGGPRARNGEHLSFRIQQAAGDGDTFLSHDNGSGRRLLADNIAAMGLAYAVDTDGDGRMDTWAGGPHLIWAVDSDNDNLLDTHIDSNDDGEITILDDANRDGIIDRNDGSPLVVPVALSHIKAVRIWLLAISEPSTQKRWRIEPLIVGDRVVALTGDGRLHRLMETTIYCRNL